MKRFLLLVLSCVTLAFIGCSQDSVGPDTPVLGNLNLSETEVLVSSEASECQVTVTSDFSWVATSSADWIAVATASGSAGESALNFSVARNEESEPREATITVSCDDYNLSVDLVVKQEAKAGVLTFAPLGVLGCESGSCQLNYTINVETTIFSNIVLSKPTADWLTVAFPDEEGNYLVLSWTANTAVAGSPAREASFTATLDEHDPVKVTVKQSAEEVVFNIEFVQETLTCNFAECYCVPANDDVKYVIATSSQFVDLKIVGNTPKEQLVNYVKYLGENGELDKTGTGAWFQGSSQNYPVIASRVDAESEIEVYAVGFEATPFGTTYNVTLTTAVHAKTVPFLPYPTFSVDQADLKKTLSHEAGSVDVDCVVKDAMANGVVKLDTDATWLTPKWNNNKLTLAYDANDSAIDRSTNLVVKYGENVVILPGTANEHTVFNAYAEVTFSIKQEKNPEADAPTYTITLKDNQFHKFVVDVDTSDNNVHYVVDVTIATNVTSDRGLAALAQKRVEEAVKWGDRAPSYRLTTHTGDITNHLLKLNVNSYESNDIKDFYIYVYPVDLTNMVVLAEPTSKLVTVDNSNRPVLKWVESDRLTWDSENSRYMLYANPGETVVLQYELVNPVEEGSVSVLNGVSDPWNVLVDDNIIIDQANCTVTFTMEPEYDTTKNFHQFDFDLTYKNEEDRNWLWNTQSHEIRVYQNAPAM